jgi:hypothetical protein
MGCPLATILIPETESPGKSMALMEVVGAVFVDKLGRTGAAENACPIHASKVRMTIHDFMKESFICTFLVPLEKTDSDIL